MSKYVYYNMRDENTYPFPNFNGCTVEVSEWISNVIPHFMCPNAVVLKFNHSKEYHSSTTRIVL